MLKQATVLLFILCSLFFTSCDSQDHISSCVEVASTTTIHSTTRMNPSCSIKSIITEDHAIKEYLRCVKKASDSYKVYDIKMDFFDVDNDGLIDMILYLSLDDVCSYSYMLEADQNFENSIKQVDFFASSFSGFSYGVFINEYSDRFFLMVSDKGETIKYIQDDSLSNSSEILFSCATFDDRVSQTLTPIYIVHPFAAECSGYNPSYIEIDGINIDHLVNKEDYYKAKEEFAKSVFSVDTNIKSISLTHAQLESSSIDEIFNMLENDKLHIAIF